jgi:hypothetical protein
MVTVDARDESLVHEELHRVLGEREHRIEGGKLHGENWFMVLVRDAAMIVRREKMHRERRTA